MTIEITRGKSVYQYRINPNNPRLIDRRKNVHRARWEPFWYGESAEDAADVLWDIENDDEDDEPDDADPSVPFGVNLAEPGRRRRWGYRVTITTRIGHKKGN